ncbi:MAG: hypothetical protein MHMPM18_000429 [Marteilia pararefringens]
MTRLVYHFSANWYQRYSYRKRWNHQNLQFKRNKAKAGTLANIEAGFFYPFVPMSGRLKYGNASF